MKISRKLFIFLVMLLLLIYGFMSGTFKYNIFIHIGISLERMALGYLLAVILGLSVSILLGTNKYIRMAVKPILGFFISIPTIAWVPILLVITGISEKTIITTIFLGSFFAIIFNTLDGFDNMDLNLIKVGEILGFSKIELLYKVYIPGSLSNIIIGLKLGIAYSWRALVGAEMLGATGYGLGFLIFTSRKFYNLKLMILSLCFIGVLGYTLNRILVKYLETKTITKWGME